VQGGGAKAKVGEQKIWQTHWDKGMGEAGDRNYSLDYKLLDRLDESGSFFLVRLRQKSFHFEVQDEWPLSPQDSKANITRQAWGLRHYLVARGCTKLMAG
jgi:hypothetical protein